MNSSLFLENKSLRQISRETGKSLTSVRYWFKKYKLKRPSKFLLITDEQIIDSVKTSKSLAQSLRKLNRSIVGSNYRFLKKAIDRLNLDISHWEPFGRHISKLKISWDKILILNSPHPLFSARIKRLIKEELLQNKCQICKSNPVWQNKSLTLRLDHKNGNHNDNRIENLRFICPNCDSQLPTYGSKNLVYQRSINSIGSE